MGAEFQLVRDKSSFKAFCARSDIKREFAVLLNQLHLTDSLRVNKKYEAREMKTFIGFLIDLENEKRLSFYKDKVTIKDELDLPV